MDRTTTGRPGQWSEIPGFRTTAWPGDSVPVPPAQGVDARLVDGAIQYLTTAPHIDLPTDLAIREIPRLDPADPDALLAFTKAWGPLTQPWGNPAALLPATERASFEGLESFSDPRNDLAPLEVVSTHVRALRALIAHWHAYNDDRSFEIPSAWIDNGFRKPRSPGEAWEWWSDILNAALAPFSVRVEVLDGDERPVGFHRQLVTAYSAMALQIRNDVALGTPWRVCANEPCNILFARQIGRAEAGQYREKGVKYCSKNCARAQVERERRRRKKGQSNG